ncbi:MAG TPA: Gfo/Idh/MocA family oxidoreductase [Armatimonadota bacterium]|jgi:scyllo-inositol 2-dehydrogenase (NADP+)|nr:Gfo/Idh/MocA family oxidoreductase [Armatimonadota bacterium]
MATKPLRIGVAGLGRIGWSFHCKTLAAHPDFELVAVQDIEPERRQEAERTYGVTAYAEFADLLRHADLDVVTIATPTHLHHDMALDALSAGHHIVIEKPMAQEVSEAEAIASEARRRGRLVTVYQPHRVMAYFQHLTRILQAGTIGEVYHVRRALFNFARRNDWQSLQRYGGGMLNNYGAHCIDQVLQLIGYDIRRIFCNLRLVASLGDADDVVKILIETHKGVLGEIDINQASAIRPYELQVWGAHGAVTLERNTFTVRYFDPAELPEKALDPGLASANRAYPSDNVPFREESFPVDPSLAVDFYGNLASAIREGTPLLVPPEETLAVMRTIERCREDAGRILETRIASERP